MKSLVVGNHWLKMATYLNNSLTGSDLQRTSRKMQAAKQRIGGLPMGGDSANPGLLYHSVSPTRLLHSRHPGVSFALYRYPYQKLLSATNAT
jgi:hypothetical protein